MLMQVPWRVPVMAYTHIQYTGLENEMSDRVAFWGGGRGDSPPNIIIQLELLKEPLYM